MAAVIAVLATFVVAGAFLWLKPSPRDQHLAKLRSDALIQGFRIASLRIPDTSEYGRVNNQYKIVTVYQVSTVLHEGTDLEFTVLRTTGESGAYLPTGWCWDRRTDLTEHHYQQIAEVLAKLPLSIDVISLSSDSIALSWDEKDPNLTFDELKKTLKHIADFTNQKLLVTP